MYLLLVNPAKLVAQLPRREGHGPREPGGQGGGAWVAAPTSQAGRRPGEGAHTPAASSLLCHTCHVMNKAAPRGAPDGKGQSPARPGCTEQAPRAPRGRTVTVSGAPQPPPAHMPLGPSSPRSHGAARASLPTAGSGPGTRGCTGEKQPPRNAPASARAVRRLPPQGPGPSLQARHFTRGPLSSAQQGAPRPQGAAQPGNRGVVNRWGQEHLSVATPQLPGDTVLFRDLSVGQLLHDAHAAETRSGHALVTWTPPSRSCMPRQAGPGAAGPASQTEIAGSGPIPPHLGPGGLSVERGAWGTSNDLSWPGTVRQPGSSCRFKTECRQIGCRSGPPGEGRAGRCYPQTRLSSARAPRGQMAHALPS